MEGIPIESIDEVYIKRETIDKYSILLLLNRR